MGLKKIKHFNRWKKAFDKIQHAFKIKVLEKIVLGGKYLNIIKATYEKSKI